MKRIRVKVLAYNGEFIQPTLAEIKQCEFPSIFSEGLTKDQLRSDFRKLLAGNESLEIVMRNIDKCELIDYELVPLV